MAKSQFNYLFTLKTVHVIQMVIIIIFECNDYIAKKFAWYVAWILLCKHSSDSTFGEKLLRLQR